MNRMAAIALFALATLMMSSSATAQGNVLRANVPFNFTINGTLLPAGTYSFEFGSMVPHLLVIRDRRRSVKATDLGQPCLTGPGRPHTLIFHRYGDQYFLSEARFDSESNGALFSPTKLERQARKVSQKEDLALVAVH
jgi:hypothetical protein